MALMKDQITDGALRLAARQSWADVQLPEIAKEAGISLGELRGEIAAKEDVIALLFERLDKQMLEATAFEGSIKDRLFDLFMARFDAMNAHRASYQSILRGVRFDPPSLLRILPRTYDSMGWAMAAAGVGDLGLKAKPARLALMAVMANALRAWVDDETSDLSVVMAKLDQGLVRAEGLLT